MHGTKQQIPASVAGDPEEVVEALDIARVLWERGDKREAVRFVRRAVEAADNAGSIRRLIALARAAADLEADSAPPSAPPAPPATATSATSASPRIALAPPPRATSVPPPLPSRRVPKPSSSPVPAHPSSSVRAVGKNAQSAEARMRVFVRTSARDSRLFVVRPLLEGEAPPPGTREAFLVMAEDPGVEVGAARGGSAAR